MCVIIVIGALLKNGHVENCRRRGVRMRYVAKEGNMCGGSVAGVAILLDDDLALG
jgi:hypothetical protein